MQPLFIIDTKSDENYFVVIDARNQRLNISKRGNTLEGVVAYLGKENIKEVK